jgi:hypothetical protein
MEDDTEFEDIDANTRKLVDKKVLRGISAIAQEYEKDEAIRQRQRNDDLQYRANLERERAASTFPGFEDIADDVDKYVKGVNVEILARPGSYRAACEAVLGKRRASELTTERTKAANISAPNRVRSSDDTQPSIKVDADTAMEYKEAFGREANEEMISAIHFGSRANEKTGHVFNYDDWKTIRNKQAAKTGGR